MQKLLIVDGHNLLFQMFFGIPAKIIGKNGEPIQGTVGFTGSLLKIIRMTLPTHVAVLFDCEHENPRAKINPDYKANRVDYTDVADEDNPFSQLPYIYEALDFLKIAHTEVDSCETDDVIAGYAITYSKKMKIVISSFDSDFFQLINKNTTLLRYQGKRTVVCDEQYVKDKYDIFPSQYADFKSLMGDASDNIKGAKRVGPITAAQLINQFGNLQNVIKNAEKILKPSVKSSIIDSKERLLDNYKLIKLNNNMPFPFKIEDMVFEDKGTKTNEILQEIGLK